MNNSEFVSRMLEASSLLKEYQNIMSGGPMTYYLDRLVEHSEALMQLAPIKKGDRAIIVEDVPCEGGWKGSEQNLAKDMTGDVTNVEYYDGCFRYTFVPDIQTYQTRDGSYEPVGRKGSYLLNEKYLVKYPSEKEIDTLYNILSKNKSKEIKVSDR